MKVVIPVAGIGAKLRPHTHTQPKTLVPIAGKPMLAHIVDQLIEGGLKEFIFVLGYLGDKIESFLINEYKGKIDMNFVVQEPREGSAHAIWVSRKYIQDEKEILIVLGDTIANVNLDTIFASKHTIVGVKKVSNPLNFGIVEKGRDGYIKRLVEKPRIPKSNLALVGIYKITNTQKLLNAIEYLIQNNIRTNNEFHLTDALMQMIKQNEVISTIQVDNWFDCGKKETLLEANAILLNLSEYKNKKYTSFPKTIIIPPVSIGENCEIHNSIIGPNVAIGDNTIMENTIVKNSIIGSFSELKDVILESSIIGNDTSLKGLNQSLNIGDNAEIHLGIHH
ncbi:MAG TPA: glucose-1-phosphate thymidylyltransferase [Microscillaceae bacterium]|nr:glucose-1-phosphate thymidylyltransferase [Microscillaceae bacterium]